MSEIGKYVSEIGFLENEKKKKFSSQIYEIYRFEVIFVKISKFPHLGHFFHHVKRYVQKDCRVTHKKKKEGTRSFVAHGVWFCNFSPLRNTKLNNALVFEAAN